MCMTATPASSQSSCRLGAPVNPQTTNGKAIAALVLGIAGFMVFPIVPSLLAVIFGGQARAEIRGNPSQGGDGLAQVLHPHHRGGVGAVELEPVAEQVEQQLAQERRVTLHAGDATRAFEDDRSWDGRFDLVISNPPYIPLTEWEYVAPEARDHDPQMSLFSGEDGLDTIRGIERVAARLLRPGGAVVIEHADTQGGQVPWIFREEGGWTDAADHRDLNNRPRFATARRASL